MADKKIDKKAILLQIVEAMKYDVNDEDAVVETVDAEPTLMYSGVNWHHDIGPSRHHIPLSTKMYGVKQQNADHAKNIKIGKDITIERIEGVSKFAVKINGERVEFGIGDKTDDSYDIEDVRAVWNAARSKYVDEKRDYFTPLRNRDIFKEVLLRKGPKYKEVYDAAIGGKLVTKKDKYEKAIENLKNLGVSPDRVRVLMAKKQMQND